jgi:hypothetical protein
MNRNDEIESVLSPWMSRQGRRAPDDLLLRVMWEVEDVSQESRTIGMGVLWSSVLGWVTAGVAVIAMAAVAAAFVANLGASPAGTPGSPSPTAAPTSATWTVRERDPVGDATGNAADIVTVSITRVSEDLFTLEIELAQPMASGSELTVWLETNGAGPYAGNSALPMEGGPETCNGWFMEEAVAIRPDGSVQNYASGKWMPSPELSGKKVTVGIPLQEIGVTDWLAFQVVTGVDNEGADWFPDETDGCYPLIWPSSPTDVE